MGDAIQIPEIRFNDTLSGLISCVEVCANRAGQPWTAPVLAGIFGHAFESTYSAGGGEVWHAGELEWSRFGQGLGRLGLLSQCVDQIGNKPNLQPIPTAEERTAALNRVWEIVNRSVSQGIPALAWSPMSAKQRDSGVNARCWGLFEGCDPATRELLVTHPWGGRFRTPCDQLGQVDGVHWLHVDVFTGPDPAFSPAHAATEAIADALKLLRGKVPGANMPAPPESLHHGTEAFETWAADVEHNRCPAGARKSRAGWWSRARAAAAEFCGWAKTALPKAGAHLSEAQQVFQRQSQEMRYIADGDPTPDRIRRVARQQDEVIKALARTI